MTTRGGNSAAFIDSDYANKNNFDEEDLYNEVFMMDARATGAFALHARSIFADNRNTRRCRAETQKKGKGKEAELPSRADVFRTVMALNPLVYHLRLPAEYPIHPIFNLEHLKRYSPSPAEFGERAVLPPTRDILHEDEYEDEAIMGHKLTGKRNGNQRLYLVRWKGYEPTEGSWVAENALTNAPEVKRDEFLQPFQSSQRAELPENCSRNLSRGEKIGKKQNRL
ncbi:hypothetical protein DXG01_005493 [Tephrocybe rancida]|nr:hypothetical protein DXG01_005493 [Tephrocybe rancida]